MWVFYLYIYSPSQTEFTTHNALGTATAIPLAVFKFPLKRLLKCTCTSYSCSVDWSAARQDRYTWPLSVTLLLRVEISSTSYFV